MMATLQGHRQRRYTGFTVLELLVVVAVISFLSSISIVALSVSQSHARDTQRKLDQVSIIKAAELYTNDYGVPPTQVGPGYVQQGGPIDPGGGETMLEPDSRPIAYTPRAENFSPLPGVPVAHAQTYEPPVFEWCPPSDPFYPDCGGGGGPAVCPDGVCSNPENNATCPQDCPIPSTCGNARCETGESSSCASDCTSCNSNRQCQPLSGENIGNCPVDCSVYGIGGGGAAGTCGNATCDVGESPGSCPSDCTNFTMCYVNNEWDLCCLFGYSYCQSNGTTMGSAGYYGVCNGRRCELRYLLQPPPQTCTNSQGIPDDSKCAPDILSTDPSLKFVGDRDGALWANGLQRYMAVVPHDPGHKTGDASKPWGLTEDTNRINQYWCSSHPDVVKTHRFCCYISLEQQSANTNPYIGDITATPTGDGDPRWTILCSQ